MTAQTDLGHLKLAGFWSQLRILLWKNLLLIRRNVFSTFLEVFMSFMFVSLLLIIRYFVEKVMPGRNLFLYWPNNEFARRLVVQAHNLIKSRKNWLNASVEAASFAEPRLLNSSTIQRLIAFVSFPSNYSFYLPRNIEYTLYTQEQTTYEYYIKSTLHEKAEYMFSKSPESLCTNMRYFQLYNTFNAVKLAVDFSLIQQYSDNPMKDPGQVKIQALNCIPYNIDELKSTFGFLTAVILEIAFLFTLLTNVSYIVSEKHSKMKEYLGIVGIRTYISSIAWIIRSMSIYCLLSICVAIFGNIELQPRLENEIFVAKSLFSKTSPLIIFFTAITYSLQVAVLTILLAQLFSKPFIAKISTIILWLASGINFYDAMPTSFKYFICVLPNPALNFALQVIFQYERSERSLGLENLHANMFGDELNVGSVLIAMLCWTFLLYLPLIWYLEKVLPSKFGISLPFYFLCMPSYWYSSAKKASAQNKNTSVSIEEMFRISPENSFEEEPKLNVTVKIQNLFKRFQFRMQTKTAVNNLTLNIFENQVTGLLGHNGAGKTTTIFMLSGIYAPTSGSAYIFNLDLSTQIDRIRPLLGFCPQHDILYPDLTVYEHLELIALIKGYPQKLISGEIKRITTYVGLHDNLHKRSKELSGGMKRRLSVAMSFTGDSKVIIMDEPTSGLDPLNRRLLWELIQKYKFGRTIILTTHFMDEADALCDRIAIMNSGTVVCSGSPSFLKRKFGHGFKLNITKSSHFDYDSLKALLDLHLETYFVETDIAAEMILAITTNDSYILPQLLLKLEEYKSMIGIETYGISSSTIEEVFLKVSQVKTKPLVGETGRRGSKLVAKQSKTEGATTEDIDGKKATAKGKREKEHEEKGDDTGIFEIEKLENLFRNDILLKSGGTLKRGQIRALLKKRFTLFYRRFLLAATILLLPVVFETIFTATIPSQTNLINQFSSAVVSTKGFYKIDIKNYGRNIIPYYLSGNYSLIPARNLISKFYTNIRRPNVELIELEYNNVSEWILERRKEDLLNLVENYYFGMSLYITSERKINAVLYYSTMAYHTSATIVNEISNLLLAFNSREFDTSISTINAPLASNDSLYAGNDFFQYLACVDVLPVSILNMLNSLVVSFIMSAIVLHVTKERLNGSKGLQLLTGCHPFTYWLSNYIFDMAICLFNIVSIMLAIKIVDTIKNDSTSEISPIVSNDAFFVTFILFVLSSFNCCAFSYAASFMFKSDVASFITVLIISSVAGFIDMICAFVYLFVKLDNQGSNTATSSLMELLRYFFAIFFPNVTVKRGLYNIKIRTNDYCISSLNSILNTGYSKNQGYLSFKEPGIGMLILFSFIQFAVFNLIVFGYEGRNYFSSRLASKLKGFFYKLLRIDSWNGDLVKVPLKLKSNVLKESIRIEQCNLSDLIKEEPLIVKNLYKEFIQRRKRFYAVNNLSFGIQRNECFGLLGLNGAGKTTLMKMMIGELTASSGRVFINGYDLRQNYSKARQNLGYCPQFDYLPEYLSVRETLVLFAQLKGIPTIQMSAAIADLIRVFMLHELRDKLVKNLSGGNKRKVSAAVAFLGNPKLVILDEPTTGMDPGSRRYFWNLIRKAQEFGITIILTSHSMEECEALCTKLGILSKGQFKCIGTSSYIKSKYGKGYSFTIKCKRLQNLYDKTSSNNENRDAILMVENYILESIPHTVLKDKRQETLFFQCSRELSDTTMADIFYQLENNRHTLSIESFSVSETTLEQVFMTLAKNQEKKNKEKKFVSLPRELFHERN